MTGPSKQWVNVHRGQCTCDGHSLVSCLLSARSVCHTGELVTTPRPGWWPIFSGQVAGDDWSVRCGRDEWSLMRRKQPLDATPVLSLRIIKIMMILARCCWTEGRSFYNHHEWHNNILQNLGTLIISRYKVITWWPGPKCTHSESWIISNHFKIRK